MCNLSPRALKGGFACTVKENSDPSLSTGDRKRLEGHRILWRARPHRCAEDGDWYMEGKIQIDPMITHTMPLLDINKGFDLMHQGKSIRSVVVY